MQPRSGYRVPTPCLSKIGQARSITLTAGRSPETTSLCEPGIVVMVATLLLLLLENVTGCGVPSSATSGCGLTDTPSHCITPHTSYEPPLMMAERIAEGRCQ